MYYIIYKYLSMILMTLRLHCYSDNISTLNLMCGHPSLVDRNSSISLKGHFTPKSKIHISLVSFGVSCLVLQISIVDICLFSSIMGLNGPPNTFGKAQQQCLFTEIMTLFLKIIQQFHVGITRRAFTPIVRYIW